MMKNNRNIVVSYFNIFRSRSSVMDWNFADCKRKFKNSFGDFNYQRSTTCN